MSLQKFTFYLNNFLQVNGYLGTFEIDSNSLTYKSGGPCTAGARDPSSQTIAIQVSGNSFSANANLTVGGNLYTSITGTFDSSVQGYSGTLTGAMGTQAYQARSTMCFPYGSYIFMVYNNQ